MNGRIVAEIWSKKWGVAMDFLTNLVERLFSGLHPLLQFAILTALIFTVAYLLYRKWRLNNNLGHLRSDCEKKQLMLDKLQLEKDHLEEKYEDLVVESGEIKGKFNHAVTQIQKAKRIIRNVKAERDDLEERFEKLQSVDSDVWVDNHKGESEPPDITAFNDRKKETKFIAVQNLKGGVGKTTLVGNLGSAFATGITGNKLSVLIVDLDFQGTLTNSCVEDRDLRHRRDRKEDKELTSARLIDGTPQDTDELFADLIAPVPATLEMARAIVSSERLEKNDFRQQARFVLNEVEVRYFHRKLFHSDYIFKNFDLVFFDCPPRLTTSSINALFASDFVLIPTTLHPNDVDAIPRTLNWLKKLRGLNSFNTELAGIAINKARYHEGTIKKLTKLEKRQFERLQASIHPYDFARDGILEHTVFESPLIPTYAEGSEPLGTCKDGHNIYRGMANELLGRVSQAVWR